MLGSTCVLNDWHVINGNVLRLTSMYPDRHVLRSTCARPAGAPMRPVQFRCSRPPGLLWHPLGRLAVTAPTKMRFSRKFQPRIPIESSSRELLSRAPIESTSRELQSRAPIERPSRVLQSRAPAESSKIETFRLQSIHFQFEIVYEIVIPLSSSLAAHLSLLANPFNCVQH